MSVEAWKRVIAIWDLPGIVDRYGEEVTIGDHMLQAAVLAEDDGASPELVVAALMHDVGHLVEGLDGDRRDRDHAQLGAAGVAEHFPPGVTEPIRLHVDAKRYLVATDPTWSLRLSPASVRTLALQGGPMNPDERADFRRQPFSEAALRVRRWDEAAKVAGQPVPALHHFRSIVEALPPC